MNIAIDKISRILLVLLVFGLVACGSGGGDGDSGADGGDGGDDDTGTDVPTSSGDPVADTLTNLGVTIDTSPRLGDDMQPLPDDYSPFGSGRSFEKFDELMLLGPVITSPIVNDLSLLSLARDPLPSIGYATNPLFAPEASSTPWAKSVGENPAALRAAVRGDFDSDGLEELAIVYRTLDQGIVELKVYEDSVEKFSEGQTLVISNELVNDLVMSSGDYDGDGYAELVIGLIYNDSVRLVFVDNTSGSLSLSTISKNLPQAISGSEVSLVIESGNIDYDPSIEFVVIVNEVFRQAVNAHYIVFDDGKNNFSEIAEGSIRAYDANITASVADVSLGDIDGDNVDELVFAGLVNFDPSGTCAYTYITVVLDDLIRELAQLAEKIEKPDIHDGCASGIEKGELQFVHVNTPDLEGDGVPEIQVNGLVYEYGSGRLFQFLDAQNKRVSIPDCSLFGQADKFTEGADPVLLECEDSNSEGDDADEDGETFDGGGFTGHFSVRNSAIVAADVTSDTKEDIIIYSQSTHRLEVWGLSNSGTDEDSSEVKTDSWRMLKSISLESLDTHGDDIRPILVPVNVNHDTLAISLDDGEHRVVFTEPIIIAVLAAAPCYDNLGQDTGACSTTYGTSTSTGTENEISSTVSVSAEVGFKSSTTSGTPVAQTTVAGSKVSTTVKASLKAALSTAYTYTESIEYATGPIEDTVIFTTVPYDVYTYTILSHPNPELIGEKLETGLPRDSVTLQIERNFYNNSIENGGPQVDSSVFTHTTGDPNSYPSAGAKDALMAQYGPIFLPDVDLLPRRQVRWAFDFANVASVGQGGGSTTQSINIVQEAGAGVTIGASFEVNTGLTLFKVFNDVTVGVESESSIKITYGIESSYSGTVSNLSADGFATNPYSWGLFTYLMDDHSSGQQFEVINYWVE